jgi:hypothetical protein
MFYATIATFCLTLLNFNVYYILFLFSLIFLAIIPSEFGITVYLSYNLNKSNVDGYECVTIIII